MLKSIINNLLKNIDFNQLITNCFILTKGTILSTIFNIKKGSEMQAILAKYTASITELKKSPTQLLNQADNEVIAILNHNIPSAYLVPSKLYEKMMDIIDDYHLSLEVEKSLKDSDTPIKVNLDDL